MSAKCAKTERALNRRESQEAGEFIDFTNPEGEFSLGERSFLSLSLLHAKKRCRDVLPQKEDGCGIFFYRPFFSGKVTIPRINSVYISQTASLQLEERKEKPHETALSFPLRPISFLRIYHKTLLYISRLSRDSNLIIGVAPFTTLDILFNHGRPVTYL
jgi:hypothetical protein